MLQCTICGEEIPGTTEQQIARAREGLAVTCSTACERVGVEVPDVLRCSYFACGEVFVPLRKDVKRWRQGQRVYHSARCAKQAAVMQVRANKLSVKDHGG